jgi:prepilin-type N-terminal cleavage/methylation domain-containing protein
MNRQSLLKVRRRASQRVRTGFTLVEILIVVIILGILGAIVMANVSRTMGGVYESALKKNLQDLRGAIQRFEMDHGQLPSVATFIDDMTQYSDRAGTTHSVTKTATCDCGPYVLRVPPLPAGSNRGKNAVTDTAGTAGCGWLFDPTTGHISANLVATEVDGAGVAYNTY